MKQPLIIYAASIFIPAWNADGRIDWQVFTTQEAAQNYLDAWIDEDDIYAGFELAKLVTPITVREK